MGIINYLNKNYFQFLYVDFKYIIALLIFVIQLVYGFSMNISL